jgi:hypothetical protein
LVLGVVPLFAPQIQIPFSPGLHNLQVTFGGDGNFPPATSTTVVEDVRAFTAVRSPGTVHLTVTPPSTSSTSQSVTLAATLAGVPNPQANFIYRFNGAFIASAPSCTFSPASVTPNGAAATTALTISTTAAGSAVPFAGLPPWTFVSWSLAMMFGFFMAMTGFSAKMPDGSFCQHRIASLGCELRRRKWLPA